MTHILGGFEFPYSPPHYNFSGIKKKKSRADIQTYEGNVTLNWGFHLKNTPIIYNYPLIDEEFYQALRIKYETGGEYSYKFDEDSNVYNVEIVELTGQVYKQGKYRSNVKMTLRIKSVQ